MRTQFFKLRPSHMYPLMSKFRTVTPFMSVANNLFYDKLNTVINYIINHKFNKNFLSYLKNDLLNTIRLQRTTNPFAYIQYRDWGNRIEQAFSTTDRKQVLERLLNINNPAY